MPCSTYWAPRFRRGSPSREEAPKKGETKCNVYAWEAGGGGAGGLARQGWILFARIDEPLLLYCGFRYPQLHLVDRVEPLCHTEAMWYGLSARLERLWNPIVNRFRERGVA